MRVIEQINAEVELDCEFSKLLNQDWRKHAWTNEHKHSHNLRLSPHCRKNKQCRLMGKEARRQNESVEKKRTIWDVPRDKNVRHQTKHERQNKGDKMLLMCVEGARGLLLYQNWGAKQGGKNSCLQYDLHFLWVPSQALKIKLNVIEWKQKASALGVQVFV